MKRKGEKILLMIEKFCDKLPQPAILFMLFFVITAVFSLLFSAFNVMVINPTSMEEIYVRNFFSKEGLFWFLENMIINFTSFPPMGLVLVMAVAVGFCEEYDDGRQLSSGYDPALKFFYLYFTMH